MSDNQKISVYAGDIVRGSKVERRYTGEVGTIIQVFAEDGRIVVQHEGEKNFTFSHHTRYKLIPPQTEECPLSEEGMKEMERVYDVIKYSPEPLTVYSICRKTDISVNLCKMYLRYLDSRISTVYDQDDGLRTYYVQKEIFSILQTSFSLVDLTLEKLVSMIDEHRYFDLEDDHMAEIQAVLDLFQCMPFQIKPRTVGGYFYVEYREGDNKALVLQDPDDNSVTVKIFVVVDGKEDTYYI